MRVAGVDIGSRTVKVAVLESGAVVTMRLAATTHDPLEVSRGLLADLDADAFVATGYGRHLFAEYRKCATVTEIRAAALGARYYRPECAGILDIGGQDTKVVLLDARGAVKKFEMNDRCAAGTGRFLEVMATALSLSMADFIAHARAADRATAINSLCTVFAESEVVSALARGERRDRLALGIHQAIATRAAAMLKRIDWSGEILFCGGVAQNECLRELLEASLGRRIHVPPHPQMVAAVGSALAFVADTR